MLPKKETSAMEVSMVNFSTERNFLIIAGVLLAMQALALADMEVETLEPNQQDRFYVGSDKNFLGAAFNWSGVGEDGGGSWATMISPQYFVSAAHDHPGPGDVVTFHANNDPNGPTYQATVSSVTFQTNYNGVPSDLWLGELTAPIPVSANITYYPVLSLPSQSDYIGLTTYVYGQPNRVGQSIIDTVRVASEPELSTPYKSTVSMEYAFNTVSGLGANECFLIGGDSGGPSFVNAGGQLALVGTHYYNWGTPDIYYWGMISGDSFVPYYINQLNSVLPSNQQVTLATLPGAVHWNVPGNGLWDAGANWTSATPTAASLVFIDSSQGCTVTGPAGPASVQSLTLGAAGGGTASALELQSGGNLTVTNALTINSAGELFTNGANVGVASVLSDGLMTLNGGTFATTGAETYGSAGSGQVTQTGGTHNVGANLVLAVNYKTAGAYLLQGGSLNVTGTAYVGYNGQGVFNQTGGACTVGGDLNIGTSASSDGIYIPNGSYTLGGSGSLTIYGNEYVGDSANGTFTQNGGTHTITGTLTLAANPGSSGTYDMQGGTVTAGAVVVNAGGTFTNDATVSASTVTVAGTLIGTGTVNAPVHLSPGGTLGGPLNLKGSVTSTGGQLTPGGATVMTIAGNLSLDHTSSVNLKLGAPAGANDQIDVTGNISLDGTLNVATLAGFQGGNYTLLTATGTASGTFANVTGIPAPGIDSRGYYIDYTAGVGVTSGNQVVLSVHLMGDTNGDGVLNSLDIDAIYSAIFNRHGGGIQPYPSYLSADVNGDGAVTQADVTYELTHYFRTNYGDANLDHATDFVDFQALLNHWQATGPSVGWADADFNGDGVVDFLDFQMLLDYWNPGGWNFAPAQTPEPVTLSLLALGGLALLRRRKTIIRSRWGISS
jgi:hypothetical protein